ncbi:MAG TPA: glycerate kinase [Streptosporangiaceae bacterium]
MRIVIAPDSFKGSIGATAAAEALAAGWLLARPGDDVARVPLADGGEGTLDVLAAAVAGARWRHDRVTGPGGQPVDCPWLELPGAIAVLELARASGLPLLATPDPLGAHTTGLGEVIGRALDGGAREIVITLGGSASTDGGTGALAALGARFLDAAGRTLPPGGGALRDLASADLTGLRPPPAGGVTCLADVAAPLLGAAGAAAVFGPQKGADPGQIARLDQGLARLAALLGGDPGAAGAGAAGGTGYGFAAAWGARIRPGAPELCRIAGLDAALHGAELVITGEGRYDRTSTGGKVAGVVFAAAAAAAGVPVALVAGQFADDPPPVNAAISLSELAGSPAAALAAPARWLRLAGQRLAAGMVPRGDREGGAPRRRGGDR